MSYMLDHMSVVNDRERQLEQEGGSSREGSGAEPTTTMAAGGQQQGQQHQQKQQQGQEQKQCRSSRMGSGCSSISSRHQQQASAATSSCNKPGRRRSEPKPSFTYRRTPIRMHEQWRGINMDQLPRITSGLLYEFDSSTSLSRHRHTRANDTAPSSR